MKSKWISREISRRSFIRAAAASGLTVAPGTRLLGLETGVRGANDRLAVGCVGVGGQGRYLLNLAKETKPLTIAAVCDVDREHAAAAGKVAGEGTAVLGDYRRLLDRKDIDAVIVAVPDHWHARIAVDACRAGKHVYCEKPLSYCVADGRAIVDAVRRHRCVFQTGTHHRTDSEVHEACELVRSGRIGRVKRIDMWMWENPCEPPTPGGEPPSNLDWDMWLGPAPKVPYHPKRVHFNFRWWRDYAGAYMTDWGCHMVNLVLWGLEGGDAAVPVSVEGRQKPFDKPNLYDCPCEQQVRWTFKDPDFELTWTEPGPRELKDKHGMRWIGTDGELTIAFGKLQDWDRQWRIVRDGRPVPTADVPKAGSRPGGVRLPRITTNMANWVEAIQGKAKLLNPVEVGHHDATICHLGNIASRLGRTLKWNAAEERFLGDAEANGQISREYRVPWRLG